MKPRDLLGTGGLVAALLLGVAPADAAKHNITWVLGHTNLDYFEEAALSFKNAVEKGSGGEIAVRIVTQSEQWESSDPPRAMPEIARMVASGEAQMGHSFTDVVGRLDRRFLAFEAPYLFRGYPHMEGVMEGPIGTELLEGLRAHRLIGLSFTYSGGANGVATKARPVRGPEDLRGLKVGAIGDEVNEAWLRSLGAAPVPIEHRNEPVLAMSRDGRLDAVVITWRNFEQATLDQAYKYFSLPGSTYLVSVTYINEKFYESLPPAYRALLKTASQEAGRIERARTIELNEDSRRLMMAKGVRPVHLTETGKKAFLDAVRPAYQGTLEALLGRSLLDRIRRAPDGSVHPVVPAGFAGR